MKKLYYLISLLLLASALVFTGCDDDDDPPAENEEEIINFVRLTFTSDPEGQTSHVVSFEGLDVDADGPLDFETDTINLLQDREYTLSIEVGSRLEGEEEEDVTPEIRREATAHQFFFAWTGEIFAEPTGSGNFANDGESSGPFGVVNGQLNYADVETTYQSEANPEDGIEPRNNVPVGLSTTWRTGNVSNNTQQFRVVLKHQPGIKMANTNSNTEGSGTDLNATFPINIVQ